MKKNMLSIILYSLLGLIWLGFSACPFLVQADTEMENANLARIKQVLNSLRPLINEAEQQQDKNARVQFQYNQLRSDINKIKNGIDEKLQGVTLRPHTVTPLLVIT